MTERDAEILSAVRDSFHSTPPERLAVAVSGGGDSVALAHILSRCFAPGQVAVHTVTVDHGLRPDSAEEAARTGAQMREMGLPHEILRWQPGWDGTGNLQDQARQARYRLMTQWARDKGIAVLALGHTADDQAETVLMRLARASGVTGLSAMSPRRVMDGISVIRPVLDIGRADLRRYLEHHALGWVEDPSNEDPRFDRVKVRRAMGALSEIGITPRALSAVARNMGQARDALDWHSFLAARDFARVDGGDVLIAARGFRTLPDEIARRLLVRALIWVGGGPHPPRRAAVSGLIDSLRRGTAATLAGCQVLTIGGTIHICREYNAVRRLHCEAGSLWDGRWRVRGLQDRGGEYELRPLGRHGLMACPDWRDTGRPRAALLASPSVWTGDDLVAAPLAGRGRGWVAERDGGAEGFFASLLSH